MSSNVAGEQECESASVTKAKLMESPKSSKTMTINSSKEFFKLCAESYTFCKDPRLFNKQQIKTLEKKTEKLLSEVRKAGNTKFDDIVTLAQIYYNLCEPYIKKAASKEKQTQCNVMDNILHCVNLLRDKELDRRSILLALNAYNVLGHIYFMQKKTDKAIQICDKAAELYLIYVKNKDEYGTPIDLQDIVYQSTAKANSYTKLTDVYVLLLRALIKLYELAGPSNKEKLIICSHMLLAVEFYKLAEANEYVEWMKRAVSVTNYLLEHNRFQEAKNHLAVATFTKMRMMKECNRSVAQRVSMERECIPALILIHWAKYGVAFLRRSAEYTLEESEDFAADNLEAESATKSQENAMQKLLIFTKIQEDFAIPSELSAIFTNRVSEYRIARILFYFILKHINNVTRYSTGKNLHITSILTICSAFKYIACYENTSRRISLYYQRVEFLSDVIRVISTNKEYRTLLKYLRLQLAIAYATFIDINLENLEKINLMYEQRRNEINNEIEVLVKHGLTNLQK